MTNRAERVSPPVGAEEPGLLGREGAAIHLAGLLDREEAGRWLLPRIRPEDGRPVCPGCARYEFSPGFAVRWFAGERVECPSCARRWKWRRATIFEGAHFGVAEAVVLLVGRASGADVLTLSGWMGVDPSTARQWLRRLGAALPPRPRSHGRRATSAARPAPTASPSKPAVRLASRTTCPESPSSPEAPALPLFENLVTSATREETSS